MSSIAPRYCAYRVLHSGVTFLDLATTIGRYLLTHLQVDYDHAKLVIQDEIHFGLRLRLTLKFV